MNEDPEIGTIPKSCFAYVGESAFVKNFSDCAARTLRSQVVDIGLRHSGVVGNVKVSDEWKYLSNCEDDRGIYYVRSVFRISWAYHL